MSLHEQYLVSVKKQFSYYKALGEKAINQLEEHQLFIQLNEESNSIATIIKHLSGNMLSRWTDFLTTDGEKDWRNRDSEFANDLKNKEEVMNKWNEGWNCFINSLNSLSSDQLSQIIYIRNEGHTVMEAINRQLAHYPYHIGQIIYLAKILTEGNWTSLSIPRNSSLAYNKQKFSEEKGIRNFIDIELQKLKKGQ